MFSGSKHETHWPMKISGPRLTQNSLSQEGPITIGTHLRPWCVHRRWPLRTQDYIQRNEETIVPWHSYFTDWKATELSAVQSPAPSRLRTAPEQAELMGSRVWLKEASVAYFCLVLFVWFWIPSVSTTLNESTRTFTMWAGEMAKQLRGFATQS